MEVAMTWLVYRFEKERDRFVVTDGEHERAAIEKLSAGGTKLEKVGEFPELGAERAAFDERIARNSIRDHGFYRFTAKSFAPAGQSPMTMPI